MSRIFITGSADGLGLMAAQLLIQQGHQVVLHARNEQRAADAMQAAQGAEAALHGDLSSQAQTRALADQANVLGTFDAVIHNAGLGYKTARRVATEDGLSQLFAVNTLAPYALTALMYKPKRLIYLSSGLHKGGDVSLHDLDWTARAWDGLQAYSDTKLHDAILAVAVARRWPGVLSNAVTPGWVATKMGGAGATDDLEQGAVTQAWLAVSDDPAALVTGEHFYHQRPGQAIAAAGDSATQDRLLAACEQFTGIRFPA